jgi:hypothetical protein
MVEMDELIILATGDEPVRPAGQTRGMTRNAGR